MQETTIVEVREEVFEFPGLFGEVGWYHTEGWEDLEGFVLFEDEGEVGAFGSYSEVVEDYVAVGVGVCYRCCFCFFRLLDFGEVFAVFFVFV